MINDDMSSRSDDSGSVTESIDGEEDLQISIESGNFEDHEISGVDSMFDKEAVGDAISNNYNSNDALVSQVEL